MRLILASGSERRRELLSWLGIPFDIVVSDFDEGSVHERNPAKLVERLALEKAKAVAERIQNSESRSQRGEQSLVIGADTVVSVDREVIGKPRDARDAVRILKKLSGTTHLVFTGVSVVQAQTGKSVSAFERTAVTFRRIDNQEIREYVATGEPLEKGGAYAIQMGAKDFVTKVSGSFTNVVGLPLVMLADMLKKQGYSLKKDVASIVFKKTGFSS